MRWYWIGAVHAGAFAAIMFLTIAILQAPKTERKVSMSTWEQADRAAAEAEWVKLENDGDSAHVVILGAPKIRDGEFRGKARRQMVFTVWTGGEIKSWSIGVRMYRRVAQKRNEYMTNALEIVRHGAKGDTATTYDLKLVEMTPEELDVAKNYQPPVPTVDTETGEVPF